MEKRTLIREGAILESEGKLRGHFMVVDSPYQITDGVREFIDRAALESIDLSSDIRALWNHNYDIVLGRTAANTLFFYPDELGLFGEITINRDDTQAMDCYARVKRGDVSGCSIGFYPKEVVEVRNEFGGWDFHVRGMELVEVTVTPFPAYTQTDIHARSGVIAKEFEEGQRLRAIRRAELLDRLKNVNR